MKTKVQDELKQHFRPEFLNRIDDIVVFHQLSEKEIIQIVDLMLARLDGQLRNKDMGLEVTTPAKQLLAKKGYDPVLGARPLRRTIQRELEDQLSEQILFGTLAAGNIVVVDVEGEGDASDSSPSAASPSPAPCRTRRRSTWPPASSSAPARPDGAAPPRRCRPVGVRGAGRRRAALARRCSVRGRGTSAGGAAGRRRRARGQPGQGVAAVGERVDEAVGDQAVERAGALHRLVPDLRQQVGLDRRRGVAQDGEQPAAHLPVAAGVALRPAHRRVELRAGPRRPRRSGRCDRAGRAARRPGRADQRAELHERHGGRRGGLLVGAAAAPRRGRGRRGSPGRRRGPATARATTRRTLVSTTGTRRRWAKATTARAV